MPVDPVELELDDDPVLARVRAARPRAPVGLSRDVLLRVEARARARRVAAIGALALAAAAAAFALLLARDDNQHDVVQHHLVAIAPPGHSVDAGEIACEDALCHGLPMPPHDDAGVVATLIDAGPAPGWTNVPALWFEMVREHHAAIAACGKFLGVTIVVTRGKGGVAQVRYPLPQLGGRGPTPEERCRSKLIEAIQLPPMPADLESITFEISEYPYTMSSLPGWDDPVATVRDVLAKEAAELKKCLPYSRRALLAIDMGKMVLVSLPRHQFPGEKYGAEFIGCVVRVATQMPSLPSFVHQVQVWSRVEK